jgi:enolase
MEEQFTEYKELIRKHIILELNNSIKNKDFNEFEKMVNMIIKHKKLFFNL